MKTTLISTAIISLILIQSCSGSKETGSSTGKSEINYHSRHLTAVIDGKMNEWGDTLLYDNSTKCIYSIANDESALYIMVKATERIQQMKIVQGGMEIWIDDKAKKNKATGIRFPVGESSMSMPTNRTSGEDPKEMRQQAKLKMLTMELTGFKDGLNGPQSVYSNVQVKPVIDWDDKDNLIYELAIPFTALDETVKANLNNISIGILIKGLKMEQGPGGGMPGGGMPRSGPPGSMRPGGEGGGRSMPDQRQIESMTKENSFWTKYTISKN
ncbi:MAG TPA: hypothetical protein VJ111_13810 [Chitinophagaceae bacterium]|nr:hypothetical protein [Chitinophagaceae bacterium]